MREITKKAVDLLSRLIETQSYSGEEQETADILSNYLRQHGYEVNQKGNNVWAQSNHQDSTKPTLLLNSHHDTVHATSKWINDPFKANLLEGKLIGLGSNDAGGPLVSLLHTFIELDKKEQPYNLVFLASAEEESSGKNGVPIVLDDLGTIDVGVVGEPTSMDMAIAERGLVVLDCIAHGESGHAARGEGINAIYLAMKDIEWFKSYRFEKESEVLGAINMTVTQINAGSLHNVVPDECSFVVDVRPNEYYSNTEMVDFIKEQVKCEVTPRSLHLNASGIQATHPLVQQAVALGIHTYGSKTMSDQVHMPFPTIKMGPGDTRRSHTADEYIYVDEIDAGIQIYLQLLDGLEL
jgi:acetylornithine deacetylase